MPNEITVAENNLPSEHSEPVEKIELFMQENDSTRVKWTAVFLKYWRFASITVAFAAIFLLAVYCFSDRSVTADPDSSILEATAGEEETGSEAAGVLPQKQPPILINESDEDIKIDELLKASPNLELIPEPKILIIHSHVSERVSNNISVSEAGAAISELLISAGIKVIHKTEAYDTEGSIGAYERMKCGVEATLLQHPDILCVIDLHDSDSGVPLTLTVGTASGYGWRENLNLAGVLINKTDLDNIAVRVLPRALGQDSGVLSLNIGICGEKTEDAEARAVIGKVVQALMAIFQKYEAAEISAASYFQSIMTSSDDRPDSARIAFNVLESTEYSPDVLIWHLSELLYIIPIS